MAGKTCGCVLRNLGRAERVVTPSDAWNQLLPANPNRWALLLSAHPTNGWGFSFDPATKVITSTVLVPTNSQALLITREDFGAAILESVWGIGSAAGMTVVIIETFLLPDFNQEAFGGKKGEVSPSPWDVARSNPYGSGGR